MDDNRIMTTSRAEYSGVTSSGDDPMILDMPSLIVRTVTLIVISVLALSGNYLVIFVVLRHRRLRTSTNVFVCNLSLACFVIGAEVSILTANLIQNRLVLYLSSVNSFKTCIVARGENDESAFLHIKKVLRSFVDPISETSSVMSAVQRGA